MDFRQIEQFSTVLKTGSITNAAKQLYTTQPALSRSLSTLEDELGVPLFSRAGKRLHITEAGLAALRYFEEMTDSLSQMHTVLEDLKKGISGDVRVGIAYPALDPSWMTSIVRNYCLSHPKVSLCFFQMDSTELLQRLDDRELDFGYSSSAIEHSGISWIKLYDEEMGILIGTSNPLAKKESLTLQDLKDEPLVIINNNSDAKNIAFDFYRRAGIQPKSISEVDISSIAGEVIASGRGFSFVSKDRHIALNQQNLGAETMLNTIYRPLNESFNQRTCYIGYDPRRYMVKAATILLKEFLAQFHVPLDQVQPWEGMDL